MTTERNEETEEKERVRRRLGKRENIYTLGRREKKSQATHITRRWRQRGYKRSAESHVMNIILVLRGFFFFFFFNSVRTVPVYYNS